MPPSVVTISVTGGSPASFANASAAAETHFLARTLDEMDERLHARRLDRFARRDVERLRRSGSGPLLQELDLVLELLEARLDLGDGYSELARQPV